MPIIEIRSLPPRDASRVPAMLREICTEGAKALQCPEKSLWAMFDEVKPGWYAEGDSVADAPGEKTFPPLVTVRMLEGRTRELKTAFLKVVSDAIGRGIGVPPENVWIHVLEMKKPDVWANRAFYG
jgi:phenylpyruvate tautomerase PptA (4-oxalocrotonate tautomerase family)